MRPESLDLDIIREMYREGAANLAGVDPRLNATRIAHRLRVGRARVAARLKTWDEVGFLQRYDVWLNPALFGWQGAWVSIQVDHPRVKPPLFARLALIDGAVSGLEFLGDWISVGLVTPDSPSLHRSLDLIRGLAGVRGVEPPVVWRTPVPQRQLSSLEVRIVRALRERPTATLSETARRVGVSTRTMTRRYAQLIEDWAVWFVPIFDFRTISSPVVSVGLSLAVGASREGIARKVRARYPLTLEFRNTIVGPQLGVDSLMLFVIPPSAAHLEELEQFIGALEGVVGLETNVMVRSHSFPAWFDRHLATLVPSPT
ncbi:MAG: Lrp/AsnC family transcriptional regulator [Thermoplasmata archaeon]